MSYRPQYHLGQQNHCPGCTRSHWHMGRFSAECAFCGTTLEISTGPRHGFSPARWSLAA
jgi:hypothetical protein